MKASQSVEALPGRPVFLYCTNVPNPNAESQTVTLTVVRFVATPIGREQGQAEGEGPQVQTEITAEILDLSGRREALEKINPAEMFAADASLAQVTKRLERVAAVSVLGRPRVLSNWPDTASIALAAHF